MSYLPADYLTMFTATFFAVFLLGIQSKNVNASRYWAAVVTSFGISCAQFLFAKYAANGNLVAFFVMATGGCLGIAASIWFYDNVLKRKKAPGPLAPPCELTLNDHLARYGIALDSRTAHA